MSTTSTTATCTIHTRATSTSTPSNSTASIPDGHTAPADGHTSDHVHGEGCGHEAVPHAGHVDFLVAGRLHHHHGDHCDDHGPLPGA